jgi:hypothetical protein
MHGQALAVDCRADHFNNLQQRTVAFVDIAERASHYRHHHTQMKQVIGTFTVTDGTLRQQTVYISQESHIDSAGVIVDTRKHLNLNAIDGEVVFKTDNDNVMTLADGTVLKKTSNIRFGNPDTHSQVVRRSRR